MQSIICKYLGPTNTKPARIKATASGGAGSITVSHDTSFNVDHDAMRAAGALMVKLGWTGELVQDEPRPGYWVHVFTNGPALVVRKDGSMIVGGVPFARKRNGEGTGE